MLSAARRHPSLLVLAALVSLMLGALARAQVFIPPPAPWLDEEPAPEATPAAAAAPAAAPVPAPSPALAELRQGESARAARPLSLPSGISFNFVERSEDIVVATPIGPFVGTSDVSVYSGRFDAYVFGCTFGASIDCSRNAADPNAGRVAVNLSALGGYANGSASLVGTKVDLNGPVLGTSVLVYLQGPVGTLTARSAPFVLAGFDYTATDFSAIEGWVSFFGVKPRAGLMIETFRGQALSIYGGASWADFSESQTFTRTGTTLHVRPQHPWAGLVGVDYRNVLGADSLKGLSLTIEGETGDRTGVNLSLRYGFDVPL